MKTCLITTTINYPTVLELYRQHGPDVGIIIAGDEQSPHEKIENMCDRISGYIRYLHPDAQTKWKCSELIGFRNIQRRNIALLEALAWGAEIIVSCDDDNIPLDSAYFDHFEMVLAGGHWGGIKVSGSKGWFDVGTLLDPVSPHRGFPLSHRGDSFRADAVTGARVGVAAGICLGDPDISASTRIERAPEVHRVSELLQSGIVVDPNTWTVFNSQNTAIIRELAPTFFMLPGVGRYDDIYASLIMQRVMREKNLHAHFGEPFVWQQRNEHDLVRDLRGEISGMENIEFFAELLSKFEPNDFIEVGTLDLVRDLWRWFDQLPESPGRPPRHTIDAALAFLDDLEGVL